MWEQYKKTLRSMQLFIGIVTVAIFLWSHLIGLAVLFFCTMQIGAVVGGLWAGRLKRKIEAQDFPPLASP